MKTANPLSPWSTLNTTTKTKMISWKSTSSTGCNTSTASLSRHFSAALCKHRVKFEDQYHFCKLHKAALKISMLQNHRVVTSLLNTQDLSWNIEPQPSSPWSQHTHTQLVTKGGPYRFFLKSKKKKKDLTFDTDSSLEVQILFLWSQGEVNGSHHSLPRPLTYLASLQTLSSSATAADKPSVQPLTIW